MNEADLNAIADKVFERLNSDGLPKINDRFDEVESLIRRHLQLLRSNIRNDVQDAISNLKND